MFEKKAVRGTRRPPARPLRERRTSLLDDAAEADSAWTNAGRESSEELYGDYQLVVDEIAERLLETRETYAATLDEQTADEYRGTFNRAARKRFGRDATTLLEET